MKRIFSFLCVLCCASVMGWAYTSAPDTWIGTPNPTYANQFKWSVIDGVATPNDVVNIQQPGFATAIGIYMNFADAAFNEVYMNGVLTTNGTEYKQDGAGIVVYLSALTAKNTEILIKQSSTTRFGLNIYNDKGSGGGGGDPDPDPEPEPDPEPAGIDWSSISWLTNTSGNPAFTNKYKALAGNPGPSNIDVIQNPGWATAPGLYMTFPNADFRNFSLPASCYDTQGAGVIFHMNAFTAKETKVHVNVGGTVRSFTIYYEDGAEGPTEIYDINFALADNGSSATASSGNAALAIDGNEGSRWESSHTDDETWTLDMGQKRIFNTIKILWEGAYCKEFALTYSNDGESWSPLYTETNLTQAGWQTIELGENVTAQYIKYHGTKRATGYGQSFFEFQVLLPGVSTLTKIELSAPGIAKVGEGVALNVVAKDQNNAPMTVAIEYEITPAAAGAVVDGKYVPAKIGNASIIAKSGEVKSAAIEIFGYEGSNLALSTNIDTDNKVIAQSDFTPKGTNAFFAVDGNDGSVYQGSPTGGTAEDDASRTFDAWFVVDLGDFYDIDLVTIHFEGACSQNYHVDFSADNTAWALGYDYTGNPGINGRTDMLSAAVLDNYQKVRYVRFWSTKAGTQWGMKMFELQVFGHAWVPASDTEAPVMVSATLDSKTWNSVVLAVEATDNQGVSKFHVMDATNGIDAKYAPNNGKITITGLTAATAYNFTVTAIDVAQNESENSKSVAVTTTAHYTEPQAASAAPTWPANQVQAMYSPTYGADCGFDAWGSGTVYTQETYGKKYVLNNNGYFGLVGFSLNCLMMEKLHYDIWIDVDATLRIVPICRNSADTGNEPEYGEFVNLKGQQWNSIDLALNEGEFAKMTNWGNVYQMKIDQASNLTFWIANAYFYRESAIVDSEVPTNVSANLAETGFYSVKITAQAEDNSGAVNFRVMNGETILATGVAATATPTTITVNNLTPGTAYNLNVVAYDDAGNAASPVVVEANTKVVPAPIVPDFNAKVVLPVFTDAKACVVSNIQSGGWGEATQHEWLQIAPNDKVFYAQNFNYAGWHSWGGGDINASEMDFLHVDIYSTGMTQVSVTPISPGHEGSYTIELTPNAWTSADIPLSAYDASNIDWTKIFQFKFMGAVGGNELMIDNVYFWSYGVTTTSVMGGDDATGGWATFACAEKIQLPDGISAYKAVYSNEGNDEVLNLTELSDGIIPANAGVILHGTAGETFTFSLTNATPVTDMNDNMLVGCAVRTDISGVAASHDIFCMRYSELFGITGFFLYTGQYIPAGKAYLPVPKDPGAAPASRRVRFVFNNENVATGVEQEANMPTAVCQKVIENGRLIIIRNGIRYTAEGLRVE